VASHARRVDLRWI